MSPVSPARRVAPVALLAAAVLLLAPTGSTAAGGPYPTFGDAFWAEWGDGQAEIATYDLVFPRYGIPRTGTAVTIFVTETFSESDRVKANPGRHPADDEFPVMKLNLIQDFPTGIYDYQLMTSAFVGLAPSGGRLPGALAKLTFSSQEWCGHVFQELLPEPDRVHRVVHSYFDGETDQDTTLALPPDAMYEDALFHWVRGFAGPVVEGGGSRTVSLVASAERSRLLHTPVVIERATLRRSIATIVYDVPAGSFEVEQYLATVTGGRTWKFLVETGGARRIIHWENSDGRRANLVASERLAYWTMNGSDGIERLGEIGLKPRPERTP